MKPRLLLIVCSLVVFPTLAITASNAAFSHLAPAPQPGVAFGLLRLWTGSVLPPMGLHWAVNAVGLAAAWALARRPAAQPLPDSR